MSTHEERVLAMAHAPTSIELLIERALDAGLIDLAHAAIDALDMAEDTDREPEEDDDGKGIAYPIDGREISQRSCSRTEVLYVHEYCACCGARTNTEEWNIA